MNNLKSSPKRRSETQGKSRAPVVSPENAQREKAKLRQGRDRLEGERTEDEASARSSVVGGRIG